jgi:hypothetical protein
LEPLSDIELLGPGFIRADANGDTMVDVADPIFLAAPPFPDCGPEPAPFFDCAAPPPCP